MLAYYNPLWRKVIEILRRKHAFGPSVQLACQKHPEMNLDIAIPEHFDKVSSLGTYDYVLLVSLNLSLRRLQPQLRRRITSMYHS